MFPIRVLLVEDALPFLRILTTALKTHGFEVFFASSTAAGMLSLARMQPDVLVLHPQAGRGSVVEWRRAISRYREAHPLGLLLLARRIPAAEQDTLSDLADVGTLARPAAPARILTALLEWAGDEQTMSRAS